MRKLGGWVIAAAWTALAVVAVLSVMREDWMEDGSLLKIGVIQLAVIALWAPRYSLVDPSPVPSNLPRGANAVGCIFYAMLVPTVIVLIPWLMEHPAGLLTVVPHGIAAAALLMRPRLFFAWSAAVGVGLLVVFAPTLPFCWLMRGYIEGMGHIIVGILALGSLAGLPIAWYQSRRHA